jgi:GTPase
MVQPDPSSHPSNLMSELDDAIRNVQSIQTELGYRHAQDAIRQLTQQWRLTDRERHEFGQAFEQLMQLQQKLEQQTVQIAVFGMVGRGKSSLLNALLGQPIFETGAVHGVTQSVQGATWTVERSAIAGSHQDILTVALPGTGRSRIELLDTPGIDEIGGEAREQLAQQVARHADLILFVVAGDMTQVEYQALAQLRAANKPMLLVFNKIDQYPPGDRHSIYETIRDQRVRDLLSPDEIVMTSAAPIVTQAWRSPEGTLTITHEPGLPDITALKLKILDILNRDGTALVALNTLLYADDVNTQVVQRKLDIRDRSAEDMIWNAAMAKAIAVAVNPMTALDMLGGAIVDISMIIILSRLYGLPMTEQGAAKLLQHIAVGMGGITASELLTTFGLSSLKGLLTLAAPVTGGLSLGPYVPVAIAQATVAGVSSYSIGQVTKTYLANGAMWGSGGPKAVVQEILADLDDESILNRIKADLQTRLHQMTSPTE